MRGFVTGVKLADSCSSDAALCSSSRPDIFSNTASSLGEQKMPACLWKATSAAICAHTAPESSAPEARDFSACCKQKTKARLFSAIRSFAFSFSLSVTIFSVTLTLAFQPTCDYDAPSPLRSPHTDAPVVLLSEGAGGPADAEAIHLGSGPSEASSDNGVEQKRVQHGSRVRWWPLG